EVEDFIWHLRWRGHEIIRQRVEKYGIACDLRHGHLHAAMKASHMGELQASYEEAVRRGMGDQVVLLDKAGVQAHLETELYCGALKNT
ncbi:FAD-binding oxidoreductase, partial [Pseudomonas aeruginosa]